MMCTRLTLIASAVSLLLGLAVGHWTSPAPSAGMPTRLNDFCTTVHVALDMDADDFASGSEKRRLAAVARFGELFTYHSEQEIQLCANKPIDLQARGACALNHDYACLAKLARAASESVKP